MSDQNKQRLAQKTMNTRSNAESSKAVVLVSGMHRSGTSAFTRVCNLLGGALPQPLVEPAIGNELGLWEPAEVVAMNDRALLAARSDVNSVFPVSPTWLQSQEALQFTSDVKTFIAELGDEGRTWFIKDPRISVLAGLWRDGVQQTGVTPRFVIAFRNPWEVAVSLSARQLHHFPDEVWPLERGLALWLNYMLTIERKSRGFPRSFVSYEGLLGDWRGEIARVYSQLSLSTPAFDADSAAAIDAFLQPGERHARHDAIQTHGGLAMRVYDMLHERLSDPKGGQIDFDEAQATFDGAFDVLGGYLGALEQRAAQFSPLKARLSKAEADRDELEKAVEAARFKAVHLARMAAARDSAGQTGDEFGLDDDAAKLALLRKKHDALKAAHHETLAAYRAKGLEFKAEFDRQDQAFASKLADKDQKLASSLAENHRLFDATVTEKDKAIAALNEDVKRGSVDAEPLAEALMQLDLIRRSTSWRITKPLRAALTLLKGA